MKPFLKKTAYILLFLFVCFNIVCALQAYHFTRFVDAAERHSPKEMGIMEKTSAMVFGVPVPRSIVMDSLHVPHENVKIKTEDSLQLAAWSAVHNDAVQAKGTILMFHGHGSCRSGLIKETEALYSLGWNILSVDFRNHGESEGTTCSVGYNEAKDVKAAYDYAIKSGIKNIALFGTSMGAAAITKAMHDYPTMKVQKLVLEMPFATMQDAVEGFVRTMHLPDEPLGTFLAFWGGTELGIWIFSNKPVNYAADIHCSTLLQWGKKDYRVTQDETNAIFKNLSTADKKLVVYENSGHVSLCKNEHDKWMQNMAAFLNK